LRAIFTVSLLVFFGMLGPSLALGQENAPVHSEPAASPSTVPPATTEPPPAPPPAPQPQPEVQPQAVPQPSQPAAASPALNFSQPMVQTDKDEPLVQKWWFWTAIGAAVVGTVVAIVLIDGGSSNPRTTLGNQEFRP
jgi:hypothetical protein